MCHVHWPPRHWRSPIPEWLRKSWRPPWARPESRRPMRRLACSQGGVRIGAARVAPRRPGAPAIEQPFPCAALVGLVATHRCASTPSLDQSLPDLPAQPPNKALNEREGTTPRGLQPIFGPPQHHSAWRSSTIGRRCQRNFRVAATPPSHAECGARESRTGTRLLGDRTGELGQGLIEPATMGG
jgi:hypothetical protein